jgi:hypothetical protein
MSDKRKHAGDWWFLAYDETSEWDLSATAKGYVERILGVYAVDLKQITYCCEITPSYDLNRMGHIIWYNDGFYAWQEKAEETAEWWRADFESDCQAGDAFEVGHYRHCKDVEQFIKNNRWRRHGRKFTRRIGNISGKYWRDETYDTELEAMQEYHNGNSPWY